MDDASRKDHLERLRGWRNQAPRDLSLRFLADLFKREVARPHQQLAQIAPIWQQLVPADLVQHTALASLSRGTLTVHVDDSAVMYELDRLLRGGLERQLMQSCKATVKRVKMVVRRK